MIHLKNWTIDDGQSLKKEDYISVPTTTVYILYKCAHNHRLRIIYTGDNRNSEMPNTQSKSSTNWSAPVGKEDLRAAKVFHDT